MLIVLDCGLINDRPRFLDESSLLSSVVCHFHVADVTSHIFHLSLLDMFLTQTAPWRLKPTQSSTAVTSLHTLWHHWERALVLNDGRRRRRATVELHSSKIKTKRLLTRNSTNMEEGGGGGRGRVRRGGRWWRTSGTFTVWRWAGREELKLKICSFLMEGWWHHFLFSSCWKIKC